MQIFAITEQADGRLVVTEGYRVIVSADDDERDLAVCLERICTLAKGEWNIIKRCAPADGERPSWVRAAVWQRDGGAEATG